MLEIRLLDMQAYRLALSLVIEPMLWFRCKDVLGRASEINTDLLRKHPSTGVKAPRKKDAMTKSGLGVIL